MRLQLSNGILDNSASAMFCRLAKSGVVVQFSGGARYLCFVEKVHTGSRSLCWGSRSRLLNLYEVFLYSNIITEASSYHTSPSLCQDNNVEMYASFMYMTSWSVHDVMVYT